MNNESFNQESNEQDFREHMEFMYALGTMSANSPRDQFGNTVVDIAAIAEVGMFYVFKN